MHHFHLHSLGAKEMSHWLRAVAALAKDRGSVPHTYIVAHNHQ